MVTKLPQSLFDTYQEYKAEEEEVIRWVTETAMQCGHEFSTDIRSGRSSPSKNVHPGGRQSRPKTSSSPRKGTAPKGDIQESSSIAIYDIIPPLQTIMASGNVASLPDEIVRALRSVVRKRAKCVQWFERNISSTDVDGQRANCNHRYPLLILREAVALLKKLAETTTAEGSTASKPSPENVFDNQANSFAALEVEDSAWCEEFDQLTMTSNEPTMLASPDSSLEAGKPDEFEKFRADLFFVRYCLLQELEAIEAMILQEWFSVLLGGQTLMGAAIMTNQALDLVQQRDLAIGIVQIQETQCILFPKNFFSQLIRTDAGNAVEPVLRMHEIICKVLTQWGKKTRRLLRGADEAYERVDYFNTSVDEQADFESRAFCQWLTCYGKWFARPEKVAESESLRMFRTFGFGETKSQEPANIPTSVAFAVRVEILIGYVLRHNIEQLKSTVVHDLDSLITSVQTRSERLASIQSSVSIFTPHEEQQLKSMFEGGIRAVERKRGALQDPQGPPTKWLLMTSGIEQYTFHHGIAICRLFALATSGIIVPLAHIYNVCRQERALLHEWPDFEYVLSHTGEETIFKGTRPTNVRRDYYHDRVMHTMGMSTTLIRKFFKQPEKALSKDRFYQPNLDTAALPFSTLVYGRIFDSERSNVQWARKSELFLRATRVQSILGKAALHVDMNSIGQISNQWQLARFCDKGPAMQATHVLALARQQSMKELELIAFDFDAFFHACLDLAIRLGEVWKDKGLQDFGAENIRIGMDCPVGIALTKMAIDITGDIKDAEGGIKKAEARSKQDLRDVASILSDFIAKTGSVGLKTLKKPTPQHISELPDSFQSKLKSIATQFGLLDDVFTAEQRAGLGEAFDNVVSVEDITRRVLSSKTPRKRDHARKVQEQARKYLERTIETGLKMMGREVTGFEMYQRSAVA